jgi:CspA family cold shock protein
MSADDCKTIFSEGNSKMTTTTATKPRLHGVVKWYDGSRGYGFVQRDDGGKDIFLHVSDVEAELDHDPVGGEKISFTVRTHGGGECATDLHLER